MGCKTAYGITGTDENLNLNMARIIRFFRYVNRAFWAAQPGANGGMRDSLFTMPVSCTQKPFDP